MVRAAPQVDQTWGATTCPRNLQGAALTNSPTIMNSAFVASWQTMEGIMTAIDRRKALTVVAAVPAAAALASPALAVDEDAALKRLWEQWKAQYARWLIAAKHASAVDEAVKEESWQPWWELDEIYGGL